MPRAVGTLERVTTLRQLIATLPQRGRVVWIGLRTERRAPMQIVEQVAASPAEGLAGDRYSKPHGGRQVTLIQAEHLEAVGSMLNTNAPGPDLVRRNIVVRGINLLALKDKRFHVGNVLLEYTGLCHPCSFMEETLGAGGYNAMRGHGGITAKVVSEGRICIGDAVYS